MKTSVQFGEDVWTSVTAQLEHLILLISSSDESQSLISVKYNPSKAGGGR